MSEKAESFSNIKIVTIKSRLVFNHVCDDTMWSNIKKKTRL